MRFTEGNRVLHFETVARMLQDELVVVGIAPYGVRLFSVRQRDRAISVEAPSTRELEYLALWVVDALHRIYWITAPSAHRTDQAVSWDRATEHVTEWREGSRLRRAFARRGEDVASSRVTIDYHAAAGAGRSAAEIHNPWCGYEAVVVTLAAAPAGSASGGEAPNPGEATE